MEISLSNYVFRERRRRRPPPPGGEALVAELPRRVVIEWLQRRIARRPGKEHVRQRGVARQHGTVEVRPDDPPVDRAVDPFPVAVAHTRGDAAERAHAGTERGAPAVVLEAGQDRERGDPDRVGEDLADGARPDALHGLDLEQPHALVWFGVRSGEAPAHHLEPGTHGQHDRALAHLIAERAVIDERACGADLGTVLPAPQAIDVGPRERTVRGRLEQLHVPAAPLGAPGQDHSVPAVAVGAEQVGVDHRDTERCAHAGAPRRSWKAV